MSLIQRIVASFTVLLVALALVVVVNYVSISRIETDLDTLSQQGFAVARGANDVKLTLLKQDNELLRIFSLSSSDEVNQAAAAFRELDARVSTELGAIPAVILQANAALQQAKQSIEQYRQQNSAGAAQLVQQRIKALQLVQQVKQQLKILSNLEVRLAYYLNKYGNGNARNAQAEIMKGLSQDVHQVLNGFNLYMVNHDLAKLSSSVDGMGRVIAQRFEQLKQADADKGKLFGLMLQPLLAQLNDADGLYRLYQQQQQLDADINQLLLSAKQISGELQTAAEAFVQQADKTVEQAQQHTENGLHLVKRVMLIISAVALVIAVLISMSISGWVRRTLTAFSDALVQMTAGDMRVQFTQKGKDEFSQLGGYLNGLVGNLRQTLSSLYQASEQLAVVSEQNASISERTTSAVNLQKQQLEMTASAMTEMEQSVQEVAGRAQDTLLAAEEADTRMQRVGDSISQTMSNIRMQSTQIQKAAQTTMELDEYGRQIDSIIETINTIAEQTNLLALNAAIEAARAGEQGRGFAVVADEVRDLAGRTKNSTSEIQRMIQVMQELIKAVVSVIDDNVQHNQASVTVAEQAEQELAGMNEVMSRIVEMNMQIASATEQQSQTAAEISASVVDISQSAEQTAQGASDNAQSSEALRQQSHQQQQLIERFSV
ncbi:hypothetical protein HR45_15315 [Shewanella mangrovi]|uniref:Chemotaxis protein n=1 Tax=Shewanella mangrovi TaxID=1515746 RepID=A0A094LNF2_9GAMM|nr:methyl-accepting chemotaxis protein [Shewanella mangrovi]KFZ36658.1 hypothetical protein HR45_15315 [Shewanella mangrovi]